MALSEEIDFQKAPVIRGIDGLVEVSVNMLVSESNLQP